MLDTRYDHASREPELYKQWEESGYFNPDVCIEKGVADKNAAPFSMVLPPPNVTGTLHMGSACMLAIEDILVRYARMQGRPTVWIPGTDHAAIAVQSKIEGIIYKQEKKTRHDLGREEFLKRIDAFVQQSRETMWDQFRKFGTSLDWSREAFTLDDERNHAVRVAFKRMYDDGLIYRGDRIVHWDPKLQTTVSDDELDHKEEKAPLYYLKYGPFVIATARPETKFGDKYVVMHPDDPRYKDFADGQKLMVEWINGPIEATVIKDPVIDMAFGTGVMTITPAHDATDFDIAERHGLEKQQVIDLHGKLLPLAGEFAGLHITKARPQIIEKLRAKGLVDKVDDTYVHNVAVNSRGEGVIEPQILKQWFIAVDKPFTPPSSNIEGVPAGQPVTLKQLMAHVVRSGQITVIPERFEKVYFHWIDNLRDWCISRQLWYGHRIPVWYRGDEVYVDVEPPAGEGWEQDPDTLDTWFSSGLWSFSTMGWPDTAQVTNGTLVKSGDLARFHPTTMLESGYDILFFWMARMILMTGYHLREVPFRAMYLHGLVRDTEGRKMSKSLDNIIDPREMISKYGADATRLSVIIGAAPGNDLKLSEDKIRGYRNFSTKIWNAARFVLMSYVPSSETVALTPADKTVIDEVREIKQTVEQHLDKFELHLAADTAYHYFWDTFAAEVIEAAKPRLRNEEDAADRTATAHMLLTVLTECLVMLHPFMPFVTEAIFQELRTVDPGRFPEPFLMVRRWEQE
jgi:valyl-tRNA synthetase